MAHTEQQKPAHGTPAVTTTGGSMKPNRSEPASSPTSVQHREPEDAYLTGGQRNLQRRVLGLNVQGKEGHASPHQSAGVHSTGSFTDVAKSESQTPAAKKDD
jgi:hypothetical protein